MGAPVPEMEAVESESAEALLSSLKTIAAKERRKHASVFNYWLSIRGNREFPPIRDLDPLEISDAGPFSILVEMIGGGENAEIRHLGQAIRTGIPAERLSEAPSPSLLSCIRNKLPIIAACRQAFAFEEDFVTDDGKRRCWVTLLPFSANGTWIDFVYGFVSLDGEPVAEELSPEATEPDMPESAEMADDSFTVPLRPFDEELEVAEANAGPVEPTSEAPGEPLAEPIESTPEEPEVMDAIEPEPEPEPEIEAVAQAPETFQDPCEPEPEYREEPDAGPEREPAPAPRTSAPGFSAKLIEGLASVGLYGRTAQAAQASPAPEYVQQEDAAAADEPTAEEEPTQPVYEVAISEMEGNLQSKLSEVRAKADEARQAQIRSNMALIEGLSAAYDFALDAEQEPEEYLRLVESQGLKIQLRSPMRPVVKLGFDGMCDEATIAQLEAVLAWALKMDLPRGSLAERIEAEGGIEAILNA